MPDYVRMAASATRLITAAGVPLTLTRGTLDDYDPTLGTADTLGATTFTGFGVRDQFAQKNVDGTLIRAGNVLIYVIWTGDDPVPVTDDGIAMDGEKWVVASSAAIRPGPVTLLYGIEARKP